MFESGMAGRIGKRGPGVCARIMGGMLPESCAETPLLGERKLLAIRIALGKICLRGENFA